MCLKFIRSCLTEDSRLNKSEYSTTGKTHQDECICFAGEISGQHIAAEAGLQTGTSCVIHELVVDSEYSSFATSGIRDQERNVSVIVYCFFLCARYG